MKFVIHFKMLYYILFSLRPCEVSRGEYTHVCSVAPSCPILCNPMDYSPPDSSVHGILQARMLEWVAMPSSKGYSWPRDGTHISCGSCIAGRFFTTSATWEAPSRREIGPYFRLLLLRECLWEQRKKWIVCLSALGISVYARLYFILIISFCMKTLWAKFYDSDSKTMGFSD